MKWHKTSTYMVSMPYSFRTNRPTHVLANSQTNVMDKSNAASQADQDLPTCDAKFFRTGCTLKLKYNIANRCHDCASRLPFIANCWTRQNVSGVFEMLKRTNRLLWFILNAETRQHWRRRHRIVRWIYKVAMQICVFSPMRKSTLNIAHLRHITDKSTHTNTHHICT